MNVIIVKNAIDITNKFVDYFNKLKENNMSIYKGDILIDCNNNFYHVWGMIININDDTVKVLVK